MLEVLWIPLHDSVGFPTSMHYDRLTISPDGRISAWYNTVTVVSLETGKVLDTAEKAHKGML
ncbi:hypothetical protein FRX31_006766 [Thalictrum thalictroides]|uniref:Uncharacterized protein n=1 Tax=Thalictrum thalictroides TaxID=46969 RepID=A0A7J6X3M2_THATH|nr:hypothetical protein FRX31_006766 [Thalictrum thalictroides]